MTCAQPACGRPHHATMRWPGRGPAALCIHHLLNAMELAEYMGFHLEHALTPEGEEYRRATMAVLALGGNPNGLGDPGREGHEHDGGNGT